MNTYYLGVHLKALHSVICWLEFQMKEEVIMID